MNFRSRIILFALSMSLIVSAHDVPTDVFGHRLPYTYDMPMYNGVMRNTIHEDGTITTQMLTGCYSCGGYGACGVCKGTGGQYWYQMGVMPCGACGGSGVCRACHGKGYTVMSSTTSQSGLTIGYDENGNRYVAGPGAKIERGSTDNTKIYDCCSSCPTFGKTMYHTCKNCGEYHQVGSHKCIKR